MRRAEIFFFLGIFPALFLNFIGSYFYFILFADSGFLPLLYATTKIIILVWPFLWLLFFRTLPDFSAEKNLKKSIVWGFLSGISLFSLGFLLYFSASEYFNSFAPLMREKVNQMNIQHHYLFFSAFICLFHSLLEEFYWRFFVFRGLLLKFGMVSSAIISSIGFSLHHFIVLGQYFPFPLMLFFGFFVFVGGLLWCGIYAKTRSFLGSWISHFFVDAAIFGLGFLIMFS